MPYDSSGHFTRIHNWENDRLNDIDIVTDNHDEEDDNFAAGLSLAFLRDGRAPMEADINAGNFKIKNMASGNSVTDAVNKGQLDNLRTEMTQTVQTKANSLCCLGDIKISLQNSNHDNWLLCNGQAVSRSNYADLFQLLGTKFGAGDGVNTFNVPDYRGKFLRGLGGNSASDVYTTQAEGLPNITGEQTHLTWDTANQGKGGTGAFVSSASGGACTLTQDGRGSCLLGFDASKSNAIYGASAHVTPINQAVNYFIKAKEE